MRPRTEDDLPPRIKAKIVFGDYCWLWAELKTGSGYGRVYLRGMQYAHRVVYSLIVGPIPDGMTLDHLCRVRHCVRPAHLEPVTQAENARRGATAVRNRAKTHCPRGHEYTPENTRWYRNARRCKACKRRWR